MPQEVSRTSSSDGTQTQRERNVFRRIWVTSAKHQNVTVQRLSRLAVMDRWKHRYRWRLVQDDVVIACFRTKEELEASLGALPPTHSTHLMRQIDEEQRESPSSRSISSDQSSSPAGSPGPSSQKLTAERPTTPTSSQKSPVAGGTLQATVADVLQQRPRAPSGMCTPAGQRHQPPSTPPPTAPANRLPLPEGPAGPTSRPRSPAAGATAIVRSTEPPPPPLDPSLLSPPQIIHPEPDNFSPSRRSDPEAGGTGFVLESPHAPPTLAKEAAMKANMTAEARLARRASMMKPVNKKQEPVGPWQEALGWYYSEEAQQWTCKEMAVRIAEESFAEGGMRQALKMSIKGDEDEEYVAKKFNEVAERDIITPANPGRNPDAVLQKSAIIHNLEQQTDSSFLVTFAERVLPEDATMTVLELKKWYKRLWIFKADVEMQGFCQRYATAYNARRPPKPVNFLDAFLVVCHKSPGQPAFACEPMINGDYRKYNNNSGAVVSREEERNTPQAFSHFTYIHSDRKHIIIDIQGVEDTYTDPQVHSLERNFGLGNLGQEGIDAFFKTHRCNNICIGLGLASLEKQVDRRGTIYGRLPSELHYNPKDPVAD
eukprot:EG_transcript_3855